MTITVLSKSVAIAAGYTMYDGIIPGACWYVKAPDLDTLKGFRTFTEAAAFAKSYNMPVSYL